MLPGYAAIGTLACPSACRSLVPSRSCASGPSDSHPCTARLGWCGWSTLGLSGSSFVGHRSCSPSPGGHRPYCLLSSDGTLSPSALDMDGHQQAACVKSGMEPYLFG